MTPSYVWLGEETLHQSTDLLQMTVTQELNRHWWCEIEMHRTVEWPFREDLYLGKTLRVATLDQFGAEHVAFDGFVLRARLLYQLSGSSNLHLTGVSRSWRMDLAPRQACYSTAALSDIAQQLAGRGGLSATVAAPAKASPAQYVQWGETDWTFLRRLVDDHHAWVRPSPEGFEVQQSFQQGVTVEFRQDFGLREFAIEGQLAVPSLDGSHYDPRTMESRSYREVSQEPSFTGASGPVVDAVREHSAAQLRPGYGHQRARALTLDDYEQRLKLESERAQGAAVVGHGFSLVQQVHAGDTVTIAGPIDAAGAYGLTKVIHQWDRQSYKNEFWCTPWQAWMEPAPPRMPRWHGVVPARITDHSDPESFNRYRIRFYWQEEGEPMLWARMMTPHAGNDRGIFFQPEVGDEVVVAFEDGDVERPVILGAIWNGVDRAPVEEFWGGEYGPNDVKRIVTKSGHRVQMVDKPGKESLTLATPRYLRVAMIEKADETGRSAIVLHSEDGDIFLSAPNGRVHVRSKLSSEETLG